MPVLPNVQDEARRLLQASSERRVTLRLLGGVGVAMRCPSTGKEKLRRNYVDMDFVGHEKQSKAINEFFPEQGYLPRVRFNAMNGRKRLIFNDLVNRRRVDIFLDLFEMSHKFNFSDRLGLEPNTLPLADLLATKLQIFEINDKDFKDMTALLLDHEVGSADGETINGAYIAKIASNDWGVYKTFTANLAKLEMQLEAYGLSPVELDMVRSRIGKLLEMIEAQPKSMGWKLRARVGDKVPWYELPEADKSVVVGDLD